MNTAIQTLKIAAQMTIGGQGVRTPAHARPPKAKQPKAPKIDTPEPKPPKDLKNPAAKPSGKTPKTKAMVRAPKNYGTKGVEAAASSAKGVAGKAKSVAKRLGAAASGKKGLIGAAGLAATGLAGFAMDDDDDKTASRYTAAATALGAAGGGGLNTLKQLGEIRSGANGMEQLDPYRIGRAAVVGGALGAAGQKAYKNRKAIHEALMSVRNRTSTAVRNLEEAAVEAPVATRGAASASRAVEDVARRTGSVLDDVGQVTEQAARTGASAERAADAAARAANEVGGAARASRDLAEKAVSNRFLGLFAR